VKTVRFLLLVPIALGAAALAGCGSDSPGPAPDPGLPESWAGTWSVTVTVLDCDSGGVVGETTAEQVLCAGEPLRFDLQQFEIECTGPITDADFEVDCTDVWPIPDCVLTVHVTLAGTKTGDAFEGAGGIRTTAEPATPGSCDGYGLCYDLTIAGDRAGDAGAACP